MMDNDLIKDAIDTSQVLTGVSEGILEDGDMHRRKLSQNWEYQYDDNFPLTSKAMGRFYSDMEHDRKGIKELEDHFKNLCDHQ